MNRLSPLVSRRSRHRAAFPSRAIAAAAPVELETAAGWLNDAKLFAGGWVAGLVFFGVLFG